MNCDKKACRPHCGVYGVAKALVVIGALNWGIVGVAGFFGSQWDLVSGIFGMDTFLTNLVFILVGLAALIYIFGCKCKKCKDCSVPAVDQAEEEAPLAEPEIVKEEESEDLPQEENNQV